MPRFVLRRGESVILQVHATGVDAMQLGVTGGTPEGPRSLLSTRVAADEKGASFTHVFPPDDLANCVHLQFDPVLYGDAGKPYTLAIELRNESGKGPPLVETFKGALVSARSCAEPSATGCDAPLLVIALERPAIADARPRGAPRPEGPAGPDRVAARLDDLIDLRQPDFSLGVPPSSGAEPPQPRAPAPASPQPRSTGAVPPAPAADDAPKDYPVWYGTNRKPEEQNGRLTGYSAFRGSTVHYGRCVVRIPRSHKIGSTGSALWKRILTLTDDRLKLHELRELEADVFWTGVAGQMRAAKPGSRHAVVFLHGYNVSFQDAAIRAAQLGCDLSIEGVMAFYSWPSRATVEGYFADEATIQASAKYITQFLQDVVERSEAEQVHVIAHSMGNRGALEAVREMVARAQARTRVPFSQFILAAPDVDAEYFLQFAEGYRRVARRTTMYVSDRDHAVRASRFLHGGVPRVGLAPPVQVVTGIDTVFAGKVDESLLGHGYVAGTWQLLNDMHQMIHLDAEPSKRTWVKRSPTDDHWVLEGVA